MDNLTEQEKILRDNIAMNIAPVIFNYYKDKENMGDDFRKNVARDSYLFANELISERKRYIENNY